MMNVYVCACACVFLVWYRRIVEPRAKSMAEELYKEVQQDRRKVLLIALNNHRGRLCNSANSIGNQTGERY